MKLYIWHGAGISNGYHDDGDLVVLASSEEEAREVAIASAPAWEEYRFVDPEIERRGQYDDYELTHWMDGYKEGYFSSEPPMEAIKRPADRVVELDQPQVVLFNGGGRD